MEGMRELLRGTLRRSLRAMAPLDRLAAAWPVACGRAMAERGEVTGYADGSAEICVADSAWLSQMLTMRSILQHDLARISGVPLTGIHFFLERDRPGRSRPQAHTGDKTHHE